LLTLVSVLALIPARPGAAQQQEQFTDNAAVGRLVFGAPAAGDGPAAISISTGTPPKTNCGQDSPTAYSVLYKPDGLSQSELISELGDKLKLLSSDTRNGQKVVTIVHVLRWADPAHTTVAFQNWYKYDPARRYSWTYIPPKGLDTKGTFISGKKEFRLVYVHLDSKVCDDGSPESITPANSLVKNVSYTIKIQKEQTQLQKDLGSLVTILSTAGAAHAPEAGYYSSFDFHSNFTNSTITVSASFANGSGGGAQAAAQTLSPWDALGLAGRAIAAASSSAAGAISDAQKTALDAAAKAVAAATETLSAQPPAPGSGPPPPLAADKATALSDAAEAVRGASAAGSLSSAQEAALNQAADALTSASSAFAQGSAPQPGGPGQVLRLAAPDRSVSESVAPLTLQATQPKLSPPPTSPAPQAQKPSPTGGAGAQKQTSQQPATAANSIASQSYTNQPLQWFGLGAAVPVKSYTDLSYDSSGGTLQAKTINRQNVYVTANFYLPKAELGQTAYRWWPSLMFGMPLKGQPLRNTLYAISDGWRWLQPFWGMVLDVQQQQAAGSSSVHNRYVRKGVYGLSISISALVSKVAGK
jgi:hypothetical protein